MRSIQQKIIIIACGVILLCLPGCQSFYSTHYPGNTEHNDVVPITETFDDRVSDAQPDITETSESQPHTPAPTVVKTKNSMRDELVSTTEEATSQHATEDETITTTSEAQTLTPTATTKPVAATTDSTTTAPTTTESKTFITEKPTIAPSPKPTDKPTVTPTPTNTLVAIQTPTPITTSQLTWPDRDVPELRKDMFDATNALRQEHGQPPLSQGSAALQEIAMIRAKELATLYSHKRPDGTFYSSLLRDYGVISGCSAENIARFSELGTVESVIAAWSNSSGHLNNIIRPEHDSVAIGYYQCQYGRQYWVQIFIGENSW